MLSYLKYGEIAFVESGASDDSQIGEENIMMLRKISSREKCHIQRQHEIMSDQSNNIRGEWR